MNMSLALPEIFMLSATCVLLLIDLFLSKKQKVITYILTLLILLVNAVFIFNNVPEKPIYAFNNMYVLDAMAVLLKGTLSLIVAAVLIYSRVYLSERNMMKGEYFILVLFATLGMMVMVSANTMLTVYLGLELLSLSLYALVAFRRDNAKASEAAMKYFILGAIASGMLLYGMSILYGLSGSIELAEIAAYVGKQEILQHIGLLFGLSFVIVGLGFKLGVVPFHMWVPDVYHGAPTSVTMLLSSAPKLAVFAITIRLLVNGFDAGSAGWQQILILLSALSMIVGNLIAIAQTNIKRMLAYSTIAHMGFLLLGLLSANEAGYSASLFYIITYVLVSMGGFAFIIMASVQGNEADELSDYAGFAKLHPWYGLMMLVFLFVMAGIPPFVGFYAKMLVIESVIASGHVWLAILAVLTSVIGAFYYLRLAKVIVFDPPSSISNTKLNIPLSFSLLFTTNGLLMIGLGLFPGVLMSFCLLAVKMSLF